jgi:hypothetical protein
MQFVSKMSRVYTSINSSKGMFNPILNSSSAADLEEIFVLIILPLKLNTISFRNGFP